MSTIKPGSASVAASKSAIFSSAPGPQRFGLHEPSYLDPEREAHINAAAKLIKSGLTQAEVMAKLQEAFPGMHEIMALRRHSAGFQRLEKQLGGRASDGTPPIKVGTPFAGAQDAKAFAIQKLSELKLGIEYYNSGVLSWSAEKAQELREKIWTKGYEGFKRHQPEATEAEAIAFADKGLKVYLSREGKMNDEKIRSAVAGLERAFGLSPWSLIRENEDGTLSLNPTTLSFGGQTVLEIGSPLGQNVDQAA